MSFTSFSRTLPGQAATRLSLYDFRKSARHYLRHFLEAKRDMRQLRNDLSETDTVLPSDCDHAIRTLKNFRQMARLFGSLFNSMSEAPGEIARERYSVLFPLTYLEELTHQILPLLSDYRDICLDDSRYGERLHTQINRQLEMIVRTAEQVEPASRQVFEQT